MPTLFRIFGFPLCDSSLFILHLQSPNYLFSIFHFSRDAQLSVTPAPLLELRPDGPRRSENLKDC